MYDWNKKNRVNLDLRGIFVKRRWRDLNPRAGCPAYRISSADPSATWVHLHTDREYYICCADKGQFFFCRIMKLAIDEEGIYTMI